ncbi:MAG: hypothetical protein ACK5BN_01590 [Planctomycetota bacterium]
MSASPSRTSAVAGKCRQRRNFMLPAASLSGAKCPAATPAWLEQALELWAAGDFARLLQLDVEVDGAVGPAIQTWLKEQIDAVRALIARKTRPGQPHLPFGQDEGTP